MPLRPLVCTSDGRGSEGSITGAKMPEIRITLKANSSLIRRNEPVTCGVPFPKGMLFDDKTLGMFDEAGQQAPLQTRVLDKWSDGSARWVLCDWMSNGIASTCKILPNNVAHTSLVGELKVSRIEPDSGVRILQTPHFDAFSLAFAKAEKLSQFANELLHIESKGAKFDLKIRLELERWESDSCVEYPSNWRSSWDSVGPLHAAWRMSGDLKRGYLPLAQIDIRFHFFAHTPAVKVQLTLSNGCAASHAGGLWDLGYNESLLIRELSLFLNEAAELPHQAFETCCSIDESESPLSVNEPFELRQYSSGGNNWQSRNHINRLGDVPIDLRGYRLKSGDSETPGSRATPIVSWQSGDQHLAVSMPYFWQNFPKAVEADDKSITLSLFPKQDGNVHELQGGEQKTHTFYVSFGRDTVTDEPLAWTRDPLIPVVDPEWVASTGVIPYLTPKVRDPHNGYLQLVDAAIEGDDTFEKKREVIDEYGWRHFGDIYGDHEAVLHKGKGPTPLVSHYNNQYDAVAGLGYQFLRSGDVRWYKLMTELAAHVIDIDIYHTDRDKAAYNHGLFWHTFHYVDADTGTHRSYPKNGRVPPDGKPVPGGGPSNEHNYAAGLMLHYFMTGDEASKEAAVGLAQWVIDMDDGSKTPFRWLAHGDTGLASNSRSADYHGPGRGSANSISVLLDGHRLTGDRKFLDKAEQLIRRCVHPKDNIDRLICRTSCQLVRPDSDKLATCPTDQKVVDAENRWFYTMFLQSLGKYLDYKAERGELDDRYAYARASLLHYARWMADNEYPYLDKPEILEYPTETWAAQDMRKCEVFQFAALHAEGPERERFKERAEFFFQYSVNQLLSMPTRTLCRPVVLMLSNGYSRAWHKENPDAVAPKPAQESVDFGEPQRFVPQKVRAIKRFKQIVIASGIGFIAALAVAVWWLVR
jgi:hypothetical protein